jgi:exopolysaccharide biosynthesis polyprenyl glycosylphosphotransferase
MYQPSPPALPIRELDRSQYVIGYPAEELVPSVGTTAPIRLDAVRRRWAVKRAMDIAVACAVLVPLAPLCVLIAAMIALDSPGPILFTQERIGRHGRPFRMLKFRSMVAERRQRNVGPPQGTGERRRVHKTQNDPRVTRVGRFLRRTCLDEIPQLINVLRGEMSIVGPRPELPHIVAQYEPWQHHRHAVNPGMTGWWQVNRDGHRLMHESTELDLYYLSHWSVWLDVLILVRTVLVVLRGVGAF